MDAITFFEELCVLDSFAQVSNISNYTPLPDHWYVGVTDIRNSTTAIEQNHYKNVNILGASAIVGTLNEANIKNLPFSFGGDGCSLCFPASVLDKVKNVFRASREIGHTQFDLDLRTAIYPIEYIRSHGCDVQVARFMVSDYYSQAVFTGGGLDFAENLLKQADDTEYHITERSHADQVSFSGLECRWQKVQPPGKSVLTMLIKSNPEQAQPEKVYDKVIQKLEEVFGFDDKTNPISSNELRMNMSVPRLMGETKMRTFGRGWLGRAAYLLKVELQTILGKIFMSLGSETSATDWSLYKEDLARQSDHRKFDDMLRLVISGTNEQLQQMEAFLEKLYDENKVAYGIYTSDAAVITCMVFAYHRDHIHFVDGSDGGYVQASKGLKERMGRLQWNGV